MNCHEIGRYTVASGQSQMEGVIKSLGTSLEPAMDLMNHSCSPTILRYNVGDSLVAVAIKDVQEGQEVIYHQDLPLEKWPNVAQISQTFGLARPKSIPTCSNLGTIAYKFVLKLEFLAQ